MLSPTVVHGVLAALLAEHAPIRDLRTIVGALIEAAATTQEPRALLEAVRLKLGGYIVQTIFGAVGELKVMALEAGLERLLQDARRLRPAPARSRSSRVSPAKSRSRRRRWPAVSRSPATPRR